MAKITDKQKKRIVAEYVDGKSQSEIASKYGVSRQAISLILKKEETCATLLQEKKQENVISMLAYYDSKKDIAQRLTDKALTAIEGKIDKSNIKELAGLIKIIKDCFTTEVKTDNDTLNVIISTEDASIGGEDGEEG